MFGPEELARVVTALEAETGSVTPGKLADLAVLDRDPFDPATGPIADARFLAALVEGSPVHADPPWT